VPRARSQADADEAEPEPNMRLSRAIVVMLLLHIVAVGGIFAFSFIKEHNPSRRDGDNAAITEAEDGKVPAAPSNRVAAVETARSRADAPGGVTRAGVHVVRAGETLTRIANDNGVSLEALVAANGAGAVTNGLRPGQELRLPDRFPVASVSSRPPGPMTDALQLIEGRPASNAAKAPAPAIIKNAPARATDSGKTYVLGKGETAAAVAQKLKVSYDALLKLNGIDDPKKLKPGQKLRVPAKAKN
jgi:LysM repeat protein